MEKFVDIISEDKLEEKYSKSVGFNQTDDAIYKLEMYLTPGSRLAKSIAKELGKGYIKDFEKMQKHLNEIIDIWQDIKQDVESQQD